MNNISKIRICMIICLLACLSFAPKTYADIELVEDIPKTEIKPYETHNLLIEKELLTNTKFDLRDSITVNIRDQQSTEHCWTFASNTVLETNLLLRNNQEYDFSERHMAYSTARNFTDGINEDGHNREARDGGNEYVAMAYYTSGRGPILEEDMPFSTSVGRISISGIKGKTVQKKITDYVEFPAIAKQKDSNGNITYTNPNTQETYSEEDVQAIRTRIKEHIMNYGAVFATTLSGSSYNQYYNYTLEEPAFYCNSNDIKPNHQIAIIGWDDGYSVDKFNSSNAPTSPGAYLVVNSYGTNGQFRTGCFYISYEDCIIEKYGMLGIINVEDVDYDKIYQYDPLGRSNSIGIDDYQNLYGANVFRKDKSTVESINEISISSGVEQQFELYVNTIDGELTFDKLQKIETEQTTLRPGYTTVKLETPLEISGIEFAVVVKYIGIARKACIGAEVPHEGYWETATSNSNESFYSTNGETWIDLNKTSMKNTNICIKALTTIISNNVITSDSYKIEKDLIYKVSPNTTVKTFKENIQVEGTIKLLKNNIELADNDIITTGTVLNIDEIQNYNIAVLGDITCTGQISIDDISQIRLYLLGKIELTELSKKAADVNTTGDVTLTDMTQMKAARLGLINL